jgi:hypothetical protein
MKKALPAAVLAALLGTATTAHATPSTTFWTPATNYMQPYLVPHITYDTYVAEKGLLQNDYGLTVGVLPFEKLQAEVGLDVFLPGGPSLASGLPNPVAGKGTRARDNAYLNAKLGIPEGAFASWQPGISAGIMSVGFTNDYSNYNHLHAEIGKTFGPAGNFTVGGYYGLNDKLYGGKPDASGVLTTTERAGFMASWTSADINIGVPGLNKINFVADYASGNNAFGAYGGGIGLYFTPAIDILTGPVFFNDSRLFRTTYGTDFMWTVQLDVDLEFRKPVAK